MSPLLDFISFFSLYFVAIPVFPSGSTDPCSDVYCGSEAGSTQEASAIMNLMKSSELWIFTK